MESKQPERLQDQVANAVEQVGAKITEFFSGNPLETDIGKMIALATNAEKVQQEDWGLIMTICDYINETPNGGRDALRAIKKQFLDNIGKNPQTVIYTLIVLEAAVKNCGIPFTSQVCKIDFLDELIKGIKKDNSTEVQEKVLASIQSWADSFRNIPECADVARYYDDLKNKGVEFPPTDLDSFTPIITPKRTVFPEPQANNRNSQPGMYITAAQGKPIVDESIIKKIENEVANSKKHAENFLELLTKLPPILEITETDLREKLDKIYKTSQEMRNRTSILVQQLFDNQEIINVLLDCNDMLTNAINLYESAISIKEPEPRTINPSAPGPSTAKVVDDTEMAYDQTDSGLNVAAFNKTEPITDRVTQQVEDWLLTDKKDEKPKEEKDDGL